VFRDLLRRSAHAPRVNGAGWDTQNWGAGILDVRRLLSEPLPAPSEIRGPDRGEGAFVRWLAPHLPDVKPGEIRNFGEAMVEEAGGRVADAERRLAELAAELERLFRESPERAEAFARAIIGATSARAEKAAKEAAGVAEEAWTTGEALAEAAVGAAKQQAEDAARSAEASWRAAEEAAEKAAEEAEGTLDPTSRSPA
jgi:hypothetical protein